MQRGRECEGWAAVRTRRAMEALSVWASRLALFLASSLSPGNSLVSSLLDWLRMLAA